MYVYADVRSKNILAPHVFRSFDPRIQSVLLSFSYILELTFPWKPTDRYYVCVEFCVAVLLKSTYVNTPGNPRDLTHQGAPDRPTPNSLGTTNHG